MSENAKYAEIIEKTNSIFSEYSTRLTVRQIYYRLVSSITIPNNVKSYKRLVKILTKAREDGDINWRKIEDRRRDTIGGDFGYDNLEDFVDYKLRMLADGYDEEMWKTQDVRVEVWVEKEALASLISSVAGGFRVVTFPTVGYGSFTTYMEAVQRFERDYSGKHVIILDFRDHDPSGMDMTRDTEDRLIRYGMDESMLTIKRMALSHEQVKEHNLAPNPTKTLDPRARDYIAEFGNECWELDALPPDTLQEIVRGAINDHIDVEAWNIQKARIERIKSTLKERVGEYKEELEEIFSKITEGLDEEVEENVDEDDEANTEEDN